MRHVKGLMGRTFRILALLASNPGWHRLSDIADTLVLQKGLVHRLLTEMTALGWLEQDQATDRYRMTLKLSMLGQQYLYGTGLPGLVQPILDKLATQCKELVRMNVIDGERLVWFASSQGAPPGLIYQPSMKGNSVVHATASGKAWLATMDETTAVQLAVQAGLDQPGHDGRHAIKTTGQLLKELKLTRKRGYGQSIDELEPGVGVVAVAVLSHANQGVIGTISVAGPRQRMSEERLPGIASLLSGAAVKLGKIWPLQHRQA
jgi:DNA-binding IclR family transcriptional regulator